MFSALTCLVIFHFLRQTYVPSSTIILYEENYIFFSHTSGVGHTSSLTRPHDTCFSTRFVEVNSSRKSEYVLVGCSVRLLPFHSVHPADCYLQFEFSVRYRLFCLSLYIFSPFLRNFAPEIAELLLFNDLTHNYRCRIRFVYRERH